MASQLLPVLGDANVVTTQTNSAGGANTIPLRDSSGDLTAGNVVTALTTLVTSAGTRLKSTAKSSNFTASKTESTFYVVDTSGGSVTVTLPSAAASADVVFGFIKTSGSNNLVLDGAASETINGATTKTTATQYGFALIFCDGTQWWALLSGTWT